MERHAIISVAICRREQWCRDPKFIAHLSLEVVFRKGVDLGEGEQQSQDVQEEYLAFGREIAPDINFRFFLDRVAVVQEWLPRPRQGVEDKVRGVLEDKRGKAQNRSTPGGRAELSP